MFLLGDTITHTLLSSATSQFFAGVVFNKPVQFLDGIDLGYNNADGIYTSTCILSKTGNGYINGQFSCGSFITQGTITCRSDLTAPTINATKIICNLFEPTTVNT